MANRLHEYNSPVNADNALLWLELENQYNKAISSNLLADGDMEAVDTSSWTASNVVLSKQTGTPYAGQRVLRIGYDGSHVFGWAYQTSILTVGNAYRITGYARGDGTSVPSISDGTVRWTGTSSTSWQYFDVTWIANNANFYIGAGTLSSGKYSEFDSVNLVEVRRVIKNYGRYPGAPATVQCGDGITSTTFPTQLVGRKGLFFDGGDYIDTGIVDPFERTDKFSLFVAFQALASASNVDLISTIDAAQSYRGLSIHIASPGRNLFGYCISSYTGNSLAVYGPGTVNGVLTATLTYNGSSLSSGTKIYGNGIQQTTIALYDSLSQTIKSGKSLIIGARHNGINKTSIFTGNIYFAAIFPFELTPGQISSLDRYVRTRINQ